MSYQVLARKLRPPTFEALVGQDHVVRALRHALDHDHLHHAYLFTGTRGVGKTTIARVLAKCLNCEQGVSSRPCGECSICREVAENRFIDLIEVDAASRTKVDDTRDLIENAQYLPTRGRYKVYLIDEVHMLSTSSFNALLKTLEEPPGHVVFLLATTDPKKMPLTVLSRCLQFQLKNLSADLIARYLAGVLADESVAFEPQALELIAAAARGSMRDALSITDQSISFGHGSVRAADVSDMLGLVGRDAVAGLLQALAAQDGARLLAMSAELAERGVDFGDVLAELIQAFHGLAVEQALAVPQAVGAAPAIGPDAIPADAFVPEVVQLYYQIALLGYRDLGIAPDPRCGFEMTLLRMLAFAPEDPGARVAATSGGAPAQARAAAASTIAPVPAASRRATATSTSPANAAAPTASGGGETVAAAAVAIEAAATAAVDMAAAASPAVETATSAQVQVELGRIAIESAPDAVAAPARKTARPVRVAANAAPANAAPAAAGPAAAGRIASDVRQAARPPVVLPAGSDAWFATVTSLGLSGVTRMLGLHSELISADEGVYRLRLDSAHDTLLAEGPVATLERALGSRLGAAVRVSIEVGAVTSETPAARLAREGAERQRAAEEILKTDQTVQRLLSEFDGRLEGVLPVD